MDTEKDSVVTPASAGSPVLGSSAFKKKVYKRNSNKKSPKIRLSDKFGNDIPSSDGENSCLNSEVEELIVNNKLDKERWESNPNVLIHNQNASGFRTASGKLLSSKAESSDFANALLGEFVNPLLVSKRENKYSFLSKPSSRPNIQSELTKPTDIQSFSGFNIEEYKYSMKVKRNLDHFIIVLSSKTSKSFVAETEKKDVTLQTLFSSSTTKQNVNEVIFSSKEKGFYQLNSNATGTVESNEAFVLNFDENLVVGKSSIMGSESFDVRNQRLLGEFEEKQIFQRIRSGDIVEDFSNINTNTTTFDGQCANEIIMSLEHQTPTIPETEIPENAEIGFSTASGKKIEISPSKLSKIQSVFENITDSKISISHNQENTRQITSVLDNHNSNNNMSNPASKAVDNFDNPKKKCHEMATRDSMKHNEINESDINATSQRKCAEEKASRFSTGSRKTIKSPNSSLFGTDKILKDIPDLNTIRTNTTENTSFSTTFVRHCAPEIIMNLEDQTSHNTEMSENIGFSTASGKKIEISSNKLLKIRSVFENLPDLKISDYISNSYNQENKKQITSALDNPNSYNNMSNPAFKPINKYNNPKKVEASKSVMKQIVNRSDINAKPQEKCAEEIASLFSTASGKTIRLTNPSLIGIDKIFKDIPDFNTIETKTTENISFSSIKDADFEKASTSRNPEIATSPPLHIHKTKNRPDLNRFSCTPSKEASQSRIVEENSNTVPYSKITEKKDNIEYTTPQKNIPSKKRLGGSASKDRKISDVALNRAKMLFGDINFDDIKLPPHLKCGSPNISEVSLSTPLKPNRMKTPQYSSTPIRMVKKNESFMNDVPHESNNPFVFQKPTPTSLVEMEEELSRQKNILEKKLEFITKKQEAIRNQKLAQTSNKRIKLDPQEKINKINLRDVKNLESQSEHMGHLNGIIRQINPQNAALIHFNDNWYELPTVTADGCTLIPNSQGLIGVSEIEPAFTSMNGIEKKLIPDGWIKNHYRWIVWKLASYERVFPATLGGCFNIDNVIKQLKYRYLREIYKAERPALRKIYEMDDVPQKRMILCISNVIKSGDDTELELTDGWYSIRAIIDEHLCYQINTQRIKIGSKLIITGSELMNCEGCHPLEVEKASKVRLKIHFNSTRRAVWYSKLGYQKDPSPLSIKLSSAVWNGGTIGRISVYILRIYPVIYREKTSNSVLWRNKNAEYKKLQDFENECLKRYEEGDNVNIMRRNVCSLLQMTVIDYSTDQPKPFKCTVWDATDSHQEQLKENQIVSFYNLTMRSNGELSCNKKSYFEIYKYTTEKYEKYRRKYVELAAYPIMSMNACFGEFDTVGFILKKNIEENGQDFWLTDLRKNFLLVKVHEGPNHCLLLNRVEENCLVAVCNLKLKESTETYVIATGSLHTIVTENPQYDFLRLKMEEIEQQNKDEILNALDENRKLIENYVNGSKCELPSQSNTTEGNSLNFSRVTSTDAAMSMINIDEIVSNYTK